MKKKKKKKKKRLHPKKEESIDGAKRRKEIANADKAEADIARIKAETITVAEFQEWWSMIKQSMRQSLSIIQRKFGKGPVDLLRTGLREAEVAFKRGKPLPLVQKQGRGLYGQRKVLNPKNTKLNGKKKRRKK